MKDLLISCAIFAAIMLTIPLIVLVGGHPMNQSGSKYSSSESKINNSHTFTVYNASTDRVTEIGMLDYICGVVAAEEPASFHTEALKAQAVAAFTNAVHHREYNRSTAGGNSLYKGADVSTDPSVCMAYLSRQDAQKKWGAHFERDWEKISEAVCSVADKVMIYDSQPIAAVFCSMSSGTTESSKDVWGTEIPYLEETASIGDTLTPGFETKVTVSQQDFRKKVLEKYKDAVFPSGPAGWISQVKRSAAGGVITASVCGKMLKGADIRSLFGLRSANFSLDYRAGIFTFTVKGYGHGVGMSQHGSDYLARQGKNYEQILLWYYKGVTITDYKWKS